MIGPTCPACGHIGHPTTALGRFRPEGPTGYAGAGGVYSTRRDAEEAVCASRPNIADTCCGQCPGATCYVDQVTGA